MTDQDREKALALLDRSRQALRDATAGVTADEAMWTPSADRWSILQYVEHLAISDDGLVDLVKRIMNQPAKPETAEERATREQHIRSTPIPRGANHAPQALQPAGKFASVAEAMEAFEAARDRTIHFTRSVQGDLRSHFSNHSVLGPLDAYQWLVGNARHAETHADHIRELRQLWGVHER